MSNTITFIAAGSLALGCVLLATGCSSPETTENIREVARCDRRWTGVAVTPDNRIFVNFPRWAKQHTFSVAELHPDGSLTPFPSPEMNAWAPGEAPADKFVCVQSVVARADGTLWVLDPANPQFQGVVPGGPKLMQFDASTRKLLRTYRFDAAAAPANSYLNDVRFHPGRPLAFLSESGTGALLVLDLDSGKVLRRFDSHPSLKAEDITLKIGGRPWLQAGKRPVVHADGIAVDPVGTHVYYQALTGRTLYRVPAAALADPAVSDEELGRMVERLGESGASDGLEFAPDGTLYLSSLEFDAVREWKGMPVVVATSPDLSWPDSFAIGADGSVYVTSARIHEGDAPAAPFRLFRISPKTR